MSELIWSAGDPRSDIPNAEFIEVGIESDETGRLCVTITIGNRDEWNAAGWLFAADTPEQLLGFISALRVAGYRAWKDRLKDDSPFVNEEYSLTDAPYPGAPGEEASGG